MTKRVNMRAPSSNSGQYIKPATVSWAMFPLIAIAAVLGYTRLVGGGQDAFELGVVEESRQVLAHLARLMSL
jgi:hypothetical protein